MQASAGHRVKVWSGCKNFSRIPCQGLAWVCKHQWNTLTWSVPRCANFNGTFWPNLCLSVQTSVEYLILVRAWVCKLQRSIFVRSLPECANFSVILCPGLAWVCKLQRNSLAKYVPGCANFTLARWVPGCANFTLARWVPGCANFTLARSVPGCANYSEISLPGSSRSAGSLED